MRKHLFLLTVLIGTGLCVICYLFSDKKSSIENEFGPKNQYLDAPIEKALSQKLEISDIEHKDSRKAMHHLTAVCLN